MLNRQTTSTKSHSHFLIIFFVLIIFGLVMLASASTVIGYNNFGDNYYYLKHQLVNGFLPGIFLFFILSRIRYDWWRKYANLIFLAALILLLLIFIPGLGVEYNNARSWLNFGFFTIQPAEIAKLALIIFLAAWLSKNQDYLKSFKHGLLPFLFFLSLPLGLIFLQPDIGTALIFVLIAITMAFTAGLSWRNFLFLFLGSAGIFGVLIIMAPYRLNRIMAFLNPSLDTQGISYHINQALLAVGSGGWFGLGLGHSRQKFAYLPEVANDSIFAILAEELGFILTFIFILFLFYFIYQLIKKANQFSDPFAALFIIGLAGWLGWQAFLNIGAMLSLLPLTGVPLPLISYGGTAMMILMAGMGISVKMIKDS